MWSFLWFVGFGSLIVGRLLGVVLPPTLFSCPSVFYNVCPCCPVPCPCARVRASLLSVSRPAFSLSRFHSARGLSHFPFAHLAPDVPLPSRGTHRRRRRPSLVFAALGLACGTLFFTASSASGCGFGLSAHRTARRSSLGYSLGFSPSPLSHCLALAFPAYWPSSSTIRLPAGPSPVSTSRCWVVPPLFSSTL